jgi:hypothetical protein
VFRNGEQMNGKEEEDKEEKEDNCATLTSEKGCKKVKAQLQICSFVQSV